MEMFILEIFMIIWLMEKEPMKMLMVQNTLENGKKIDRMAME